MSITACGSGTSATSRPTRFFRDSAWRSPTSRRSTRSSSSAALRGAQVAMLNPARFPHLFPVRAQLTSAPADLVGDLAAVLAAAAAATGKSVPPQLASAVGEARVTDAHRAATQTLLSGERRA